MTSGKGGSYFYAIVGISLVLLVLGVAGVLLIEAKRVSTDLRENFTVEVVLSDSVAPSAIQSLQTRIKGKSYVKNITFVSKEEAIKFLVKDIAKDEDPLDILGYNPLYNSFLINLYQNSTNAEGFETVRKELSVMPGVEKINFQKNILDTLTRTMGRASLIVLALAGLLLAFAISLIFNTIRLAMFSKRFNIKTMQLFGATKWFIIKPFLGKSIFNGLLSGLIACILLLGGIWYFDYTMPDLALQRDLYTFALLFGALVLFGIIISFLSTLTAVLRYLRIKVEDLY